MKRALVLSSGGVDSTTCVSIAVTRLGKENVTTVSVYYGQKHSKELECAKKIAEYYGVEHKVIDLSKTGIMDSSNCPLLQHSTEEIKHESYADQIAHDGEGMVRTYVPFRNGLLLASVAALAMSIYPNDEVDIYLGAHADDAAGNAYADCSEEFTSAMNTAISIGTYNKVHLEAPLVNFNKAAVVKWGLSLGTPYELTWSCYEGGDKPCGTCGTCIDRAAAFKANGVEDPALRKE
jgi:7-cyano-7-deazaguanine synthase